MSNFSWHDALVILSFFACIGGLVLLKTDRSPARDEIEAADHMLIMMSFSYWLVYCVAFGLQKIISPELEIALVSMKLTAVLSYLLTASCILSLPLNRVSLRQPE